MKRTLEQLIDHLISRSVYDEETGCILWIGPVAGKGYGVTSYQSKQVYIHRIAYQFENPTEKLNVIRHTCDTPNCWNINHLRNGTTQDNVDDKVQKRRHVFGKDNYNTIFTEDDIKEIRSNPLNLYRMAEKYKVTPSTIFYIRKRKTWKHVA
jgi:hypothetical protein